jgi:hypothetical protein
MSTGFAGDNQFIGLDNSDSMINVHRISIMSWGHFLVDSNHPNNTRSKAWNGFDL